MEYMRLKHNPRIFHVVHVIISSLAVAISSLDFREAGKIMP